MSTISQRQLRERRQRGKAGMLAVTSQKRNRITTLTNSDPQRRASKTLTVDTFSAGHVYTVTIEGRELTYTAVTADSNTTGVASKLAGVINADPQVRGLVKAEADAAVITLSALLPGMAFSASESDARLTLADVAGALEADPVPFGRVLFHGAGTDLAKLPDAADVSGDTLVFTPDVANSEAYDISIIDQDGVSSLAAYSSDGSATAQEIVEGLKSALDGLSITGLTASEDDSTLTVTLPHGYSIDYAPEQFSSVVRTRGTSIHEAFAGLSVHSQDEEGSQYSANSAMMVLESDGQIFVENDQSPSRGDRCYVETADGDNKGKVYNSNSATRIELPMCRFESDAGDGLAIIRIS